MGSASDDSAQGSLPGILPEGRGSGEAKATRTAMGLLPVAAVSGLVAVGLWGAWVTLELTTQAETPSMARIQLSSMVGDYVQAQARSSTPPDQVTAETRAFMAEIERNLKARGAKGQIVLVGEAVLAGNVPDITAEVRRQVFAKVRMPLPAQQAAQSVMGAMQQAMADPRLAGQGNGPRN